MINNDSVVTAYDEHLTLVEWLQKVEVLLKNNGLKETILNDKGNATFSLTLVFNDGTKLESNAMTLASVNTALTALNSDIDDLKKYKGFENITYDKTNCVRISNGFSTNFDIDEMALKPTEEITLSSSDVSKVREIILKAVKYGFVVEPIGNSFMITPLIQVTFDGDKIDAYFGFSADSESSPSGTISYELKIRISNGQYKYYCKRIEV